MESKTKPQIPLQVDIEYNGPTVTCADVPSSWYSGLVASYFRIHIEIVAIP